MKQVFICSNCFRVYVDGVLYTDHDTITRIILLNKQSPESLSIDKGICENCVNRHHKRCRSHGGSDDDRNISIVSVKKHSGWHALFGNLKPHQIADEINKTWLDPDWTFIAVKRK